MKKIKNLLQNHFAQIFEIRYVVLSSGVFNQICSDEGVLESKMAPAQRVLGLNCRKNIQKSSSSNHLPQMLEIRYVALPS